MQEAKKPEKEAHRGARMQAAAEPVSAAVDPRSAAGNMAVQSLLRSNGAPLDPSLRNQYQRGPGNPLENVRVYTDAHANAAARGLGARAFTWGNRIVFASGMFDPGTRAGASLLTHELTHVEQQERSPSLIGIQRQSDAGMEPSAPIFSGVPLDDVRAAMAESNSTAGVGNFPRAFSILNGLSMHDLLRTLDALTAHSEIDVLAANILSAQAFDMPRLKLAITVVQNLHAAVVTSPALIPDSISAEDRQEIVNYTVELRQKWDTEALGQAAAFKPTNNSPLQILQQFSVIDRNLTWVEQAAASINLTPGLDLVKALVRSRHDELASSGDASKVLIWGPAAAAQTDIVVRAAGGLAGARSQLLAAKGEDSSIDDIPMYLRGPLIQVAKAHLAAIQASDYAQIGYGLLARAEDLTKSLQIQIQEEKLDDTATLLQKTKTMSGGALDLTGRVPQDLGAQLETARGLLDKDPERAHEITQKVQEQISDLHQMALAVHMATQLGQVRNTVVEVVEKCADKDFPEHEEKLAQMEMRLGPLRFHWDQLKDAYIRNDKKAQESGWKVVRAERMALGALLKSIDDEVKAAYHDIEVSDLIFHLTVLVLIAVLTWGAGLFFEGLAAGLGLAEGGLGAAALTTGGEAFVFTAASTALVEKDKSVGKFAKDLVINWITFGVMRGASLGYRALFGASAKTFVGGAGELVLLFIGQTAVSLMLTNRQRRAEGKKELSDAEVQNVVFEGVVVAVATMIAGRVGKAFMPEIQARGGPVAARLAEVNKMRAELRVEVKRYIPEKGPEIGVDPTPSAPLPESQQKRIGPQDKETFQRIVELDAESLKTEAELLEELESAEKDPNSTEAQHVKAARTLNTQALEKNQVSRLHLALEPAGPNEMLCDQGTFDELVAYERANEQKNEVNVTEGRDNDGARNVVVTPKPPSAEPPLRITEKLTPGADTAVTSAPEAVTANEPVPAESQFKTFEELLNEDQTAFKDSKLEDAYQKYLRKKKPAEQKSRRGWAKAQSSVPYRPILKVLGPDFFKEAQQLMDIRDKARPRDYTPDRYLADEAAVRIHIEKVLQKAGINMKDGIPDGKITVGAFNGAKGKVAEILARGAQADVLAAIRADHPNAVILRGIRIRYMKNRVLTDSKLYTDDLIGEYIGNDLHIYGRFEVKSGPGGGYEATVQFHTWVEKRLEAGSILKVPGRPDTIYGRPTAELGAAFNMTNAPTYIISARNSEHLGLGSDMQTTTEHNRIALDTSADEIEFLTRILLEPYISPKPH